jgi:pimeloyl-ACP methyl ester carboxylesterase
MDSPHHCDPPTGFLTKLPILRALGQKPSEVVLREPGDRFLSAPRPIRSYALEHWEFAWLSVAAYGKTEAGQQRAKKEENEVAAEPESIASERHREVYRSPESVLEEAGWKRWEGFPPDGLLAKIRSSHLRVEVWEKRVLEREEGGSRPAVAVAFGGTVFNNGMDWRANLRWFLPGRNDEYTQVVRTFAPAFVQEFERRLKSEGGQYLSNSELFATGHSLGGGLAQQFAYSLPLTPSVARVHTVYAFDPSPVTGFYSVPVKLRDKNKWELFIDRIYERGEILALARSLTSLVYKPSKQHATIRGVRYSLFHNWNPIADHSIFKLAAKLESARSRQRGQFDPTSS